MEFLLTLILRFLSVAFLEPVVFILILRLRFFAQLILHSFSVQFFTLIHSCVVLRERPDYSLRQCNDSNFYEQTILVDDLEGPSSTYFRLDRVLFDARGR